MISLLHCRILDNCPLSGYIVTREVMRMLIIAPITLTPEVYRFYMHMAEKQPGTTPEEIMSNYLTEFVRTPCVPETCSNDGTNCK